MRIGMGYDVHRLIAGRRLVIGGVDVPFDKGLLGHSDADVLAHAVGDAVLGAAGLGDIGRHFPPDDPAFEDADSLVILSHCARMAAETGLVAVNVDATVVAERPELAPYRSEMEANLARALEIDVQRVNVKATTTEGLGFAGRGEGIGALSVVMLAERSTRGI